MLIRIFSPTECGLIRDADLKKCGLNRMTTVFRHHALEQILTSEKCQGLHFQEGFFHHREVSLVFGREYLSHTKTLCHYNNLII
jgi:hypothetical protein